MARTPNQAALLAAAKGYCERGLAVVPIVRGEKRPTLAGWQTRRLDWPELEELIRAPDVGGVGVVAGALSGNLAILDFDGDGWADVYDAFTQAWPELDIAPTVITGSGRRHIWLRCPDFSPDFTSKRYPRPDLNATIELRCNASACVAPPSGHPSGGTYAWANAEAELVEVPFADLRDWLADWAGLPTGGDGARPGVAPPVEGEIPDGARNANLTSLAGTMRRRGMTRGEIEAALQAVNRSRCKPPLDPDEVAAIAASVSRYAPEGGGDPPPENLTDLGNARRLVNRHGAGIRYCARMGGWLLWDGRRWQADDTGGIARLAKETVASIYAEAGRAQDEDARKATAKWGVASEAAVRIRAMLELAATEEAVVARAEAFDADPWLLNVENGTIDLRTGELGPHRCEDMLTKMAPVEYDPDARSDTLERYLDDSTKGDADFRAYLQQAVGYTLTGDTREETVFLVLGPGATGKTSLVEAMLAVLGDYGVKAAFSSFLSRREGGDGDPPRPDLLAMRGARLVAATEPERGRRLAASAVKELSGGDKVTARGVYAKWPVTFTPTFKLWLAANDAPIMSDDDTGLWRRLKRLPFEHVIPEDERDPEVKRGLCSPVGRKALLAWAVRGCLAWQRDRLRTPTVVRARTDELRAAFDPLAGFFDECCYLDDGAECAAKDLRDAYVAWAQANGARPINDREWGQRLANMGCERIRASRGGVRAVWWRGIGLISDSPDPAPNGGDDRDGHTPATPAIPNGVLRDHSIESSLMRDFTAEPPEVWQVWQPAPAGGSLDDQVLAVLAARGAAGYPSVALALKADNGAVRGVLERLLAARRVVAVGGGRYALADGGDGVQEEVAI